MYEGVRLEVRKINRNTPGSKIYEKKNLRDPVLIQNALFDGEEARDFLETNVIQVENMC